MRKKDMLACVLNKTLPLPLLSYISSYFNNNLIVLAYHRVLETIPDNNYPYDAELVSANVEQFEYQMKYISTFYNPISEDKIAECLENNISIPKRSVLVTFDDGFDDNYYYAYPILKKYNIPATIFISTGYIGSETTLWFDWLASLVFSSTTNTIDIPQLKSKYIRGEYSENKEIMVDLIKKLRKVSNKSRLEILSYLKEAYSKDMQHIDQFKSHPLSWNQVKEMSNQGINFGSHTVTHPILSRLEDDELEFELVESKNKIELELNKPVISISYPTGMQDSFSRKVLKKVKGLGYKLGFTYIHKKNRVPIDNKYSMYRYHIESHVNESFFNSMLVFPKVFKD